MALKQKQYNAKLLDEVQRGGLTASLTDERIRSYDDDQKDQVCYFLVNGNQFSNSPSTPGQLMQRLSLHPTEQKDVIVGWQERCTDGLWSLALEREFLHTDAKKEKSADLAEWEDRLACSLLLIFHSEELLGTDISSYSKNVGSPILDKSTDAISSSALKMILAHQVNSAWCSNPLGETPVKKVGICLAKIGMGGALAHNEFLYGPDYASALKLQLQRGYLEYPFAAHLLRLATRRDVLRFEFLRKQLSLTECLTFYKADNVEVALRRIAHAGHREDVECLFKLAENQINIDVDAKSSSTGQTALHHAAKRGKEGIFIVKSLLQHNADPDIPDNNQDTPRKILGRVGINIDDIMSGEFAKARFKTRAIENLSAEFDSEFMRQNVGRHYQASGLTRLTC